MDRFNPEAPNDKVYKYTCRANDYFERQLYVDAIQDYTRAISAIVQADDHHYSALLHSNRSAAHFKLKNWEYAEKDAIETIKLEPEWAKVSAIELSFFFFFPMFLAITMIVGLL
jgi:tetratricopeptide (TPR) repeat protein